MNEREDVMETACAGRAIRELVQGWFTSGKLARKTPATNAMLIVSPLASIPTTTASS